MKVTVRLVCVAGGLPPPLFQPTDSERNGASIVPDDIEHVAIEWMDDD